MAVIMEGVFCLLNFNISYFNMIYLLTAIGLTSGGSSAVRIYTQTIHRPTQWNGIYRTHNNENA